MKLTLGDAARATGISKGTLSKAIKSGKLSAERNEDRSFSIDPAELFRVFPKPVEPVKNERFETPNDIPEIYLKMARAQIELEAAQKETASLRDTIADLRADRDAWRTQVERQTLLLQDQYAKGTATASARTGWFGRLLKQKAS